MLSLEIRFSQVFVSQFDSVTSFDSAQQKLNKQAKIQVQKGNSISIWTEQQFDDKLAMMRDGLSVLEIQKQASLEIQETYAEDETYDKQKFQTEIFEDDIVDDSLFDGQLKEVIAQKVDTQFLKSAKKEETKTVTSKHETNDEAKPQPVQQPLPK